MPDLRPARCNYSQLRLPSWFKQEIPGRETLKIRDLISGLGVHTVCREAVCPNMTNCFNDHELTFMILGNTCTRTCSFCAVKKERNYSGALDHDEPRKIADAVRLLRLKYTVITSVTRDDLIDGGSSVFAEVIRLIKSQSIDTKVEVLVPDFNGNTGSVKEILSAKPDVFAHNIETVNRLYDELRPKADYMRSLGVLRKSKELNKKVVTKSSIVLGLGETEEEIIKAMEDLRSSNCDILVLGQYLAPSKEHYPVKEFVSVGRFEKYRKLGMYLGFRSVLSMPIARSSYKAEKVFQEAEYV